jgi:hypothetical protein
LSDWYLETVDDYLKGRRSHKHILTSCETFNDKDADVSDDFIKLLGLYLSEGSIAYSRKGCPKYIYISQLENGKACNILDGIKDFDVSVSKHFRKGRNELTYILNDEYMVSEFSSLGEYSQDKKMPFDLVMSFSKRQVEVFVEALLAGDGHKHKKGHSIYYTCSERLADDLFSVLIKNGFSSQMYGPYQYKEETPMYQIFISGFRKGNPAIMMSKMKPRGEGYSGWMKYPVEMEKIVCFTVPNGILITRNKGKVAIQGNSKNMMHCMRLMWSGKSILEGNEPIVRFTGEQLQHLKDIRAGVHDYDYLMEWVENEKADLEKLKDKTPLPHSVDREAVDKLYRELSK